MARGPRRLRLHMKGSSVLHGAGAQPAMAATLVPCRPPPLLLLAGGVHADASVSAPHVGLAGDEN